MKKIIIFLLSLVFMVGLTGCNGSKDKFIEGKYEIISENKEYEYSIQFFKDGTATSPTESKGTYEITYEHVSDDIYAIDTTGMLRDGPIIKIEMSTDYSFFKVIDSPLSESDYWGLMEGIVYYKTTLTSTENYPSTKR